jgi:4a-hydroxytetrahydrobiopterin dehydratase
VSPPRPLDDHALRAALAQLPGWRHQDGALMTAWRFASFGAVMDFMADVRLDIEAADHHPWWSNVYDRLEVRLSTHEAGGRVTVRDVELAKLLHWRAGHHGAVGA